MRAPRATGYVCRLAAAHAAGQEILPPDTRTISVRLVNVVRIPAVELQKATGEASWIFSNASMNVDWIVCRPVTRNLSKGDPCREDPDPLAFSAGLVEKAHEFLPDSLLGFALVYSGHRDHAAVIYPRVVNLARANPGLVETDQVLAYAIVHELAHLILGTTSHGSKGILRGSCRQAELVALNQRRLLFSPDEIAQLHLQLFKRANPESEPTMQSKGKPPPE